MNNQGARLHWLGNGPKTPVGVTFGFPWHRGELRRDEPVALLDAAGNKVELQSWPTAFWPDGSVKWTAHAAVFSPASSSDYRMTKDASPTPTSAVRVAERETEIEIDTGSLACRLRKTGTSIVGELRTKGGVRAIDGRLVALREEREADETSERYRVERFESRLASVVVEQAGPVRAVVRAEGVHKARQGDREWLPFVLRFYFYAGQSSVRVVHSFVFDDDGRAGSVKGLGMAFTVPQSGALHDRHVRLAGDTGFFHEPVRLLPPFFAFRHRELCQGQVDGEKVDLSGVDERATAMVEDMCAWDAYKLVQASADHYRIQKRTGKDYCWLDAASGGRSEGLAFLGGPDGGVAVAMRHFWQKHPASIEIEGMTEDDATVTAWFWSPDAQAMDMLPYDAPGKGGKSSYGSMNKVTGKPYGIANTSELTLWCFDAMPALDDLKACASQTQSPSLLVCEPERYHATKALGVWSLIDRSEPAKAWIEDQLDTVFDFYRDEIEARRWYGFWNFGDIMHTYDPARHAWRYDVGGYAWQNTELVPTYWFWHVFLRSGREDAFRMAEAMARHASEVDTYHLGDYAGLGTRHNVVHWGCSAKEARVSMAGHHRFYYYLTADERIGDILREVKDADFATAKEMVGEDGERVRLDPMRSFFPKDEHPAHIRSGPDWAAFCSNWLAEWERFEDEAYRDKILTGIACLKAMPHRLLSGSTFGYDPRTSKLHHIGDGNYQYHMVVGFGAPQVWMELAHLLDDPEWDEMLAEFGAFYNLDAEEKERQANADIANSSWGWPMLSSGMVAYAARKRNDRELAKLAWGLLLEDGRRVGRMSSLPVQPQPVDELRYVRPIVEIPTITTNAASQWCLNVILALELIGDDLEEALSSRGVS